ncbi:MAG: GGDEF domain-containing protein [Lachnospiraceae bacterium]|nr:GGDEF domain-containing protein [Lachnospiraceae bacterium]
MAVILVSLISLSELGQNKSKKTVEEYFKDEVTKTADSFSRSLKEAEATVNSMVDFIASEHELRQTTKTHLADSLKKNTNAKAVAIVDASGAGFDDKGYAVDLSGTSYFSELDDDAPFSFVKGDGLTGLPESLILAKPIVYGGARKGFVIVCFDGELFSLENIYTTFEKTSFYGIVDDEGMCPRYFGIKNMVILNEIGMWENLKELCGQDAIIDSIRDNSLNETQLLHVKGAADSRVYVVAPLHMNDWRMVVSVNRTYFDSLQNRDWQRQRLLCWEIGIATVGFFITFLVFSLFNRRKENANKQELEVKADTDLLTGLYNNIATEKLIKNYIAQNPDGRGLLILLDLDNFKKINDTLGHGFGDEVLQYLGMRLGSQFRVTDIVGRIGGDEFMVFLKDMKTQEYIEAEARKMSRFFNNFQVGEYTKFYATASMGAAVYPDDGKTFDALYRAADTALYKAKKNGKKQLAFFGKDN